MPSPDITLDNFLSALKTELGRRLHGSDGAIVACYDLLDAALHGADFSATPFEELPAILADAAPRWAALTNGEAARMIAGLSESLVDMLQCVADGGLGMSMARTLVAAHEESRSAGGAEPSDAPADDLDILFGGEPDEPALAEDIVSRLMAEAGIGSQPPAIAAAAPLDAPANGHAAAREELAEEPEAIQQAAAREEAETEVDILARIDEAIAPVAESAPIAQEILNEAPAPAEIPAPVAERDAAPAGEPLLAAAIAALEQETPAAPVAKPIRAGAADTAIRPRPVSSHSASRDAMAAIVAQLRGKLKSLAKNGADGQTIAAVRALVMSAERPGRRLGYKTLGSLVAAAAQTAETLLDSRLPAGTDFVGVFEECSQTLALIRDEALSKNKTHYDLIAKLDEVRSRIEDEASEARERREAEREAIVPEIVEAPAEEASTPALRRRADLTELQEIFLVESGEHIDEMTRNLLAIEKSPDNGEIIHALMRSAHSIKGSAGLVKFGEVAALAHAMEDLLTLLRDERLRMGVEAVNLTLAGVDRLQAMLRAVESGEASSAMEPAAALADRFRSLTGRIQANLALYRSAPEKVESAESAAAPAAAEAKPDTVKFVRVEIGQLDALMNLAADLVINRTRLSTQIEAIQESLGLLGDCRRRLQRSGQRLRGSLAKSREHGGTVALAGAGGGGPAGGRSISYGEQGRSILSDFADSEFDRFTEFDVIARDLRDGFATMEDLSRGMGSIAGEMDQNLSHVSAIINELHESIMRARMIPIGQVFSRFPRAVRDLAKRLGKEIRLEIAGEGALLDKSIIEEIADPLMHLVRNCADHGLEAPEEREAAGKPQWGSIRLSARQIGGQVAIEIRDDGRGVQLSSVRRTAVKNGFLGEARAAEAGDQELLALLLRPGFSTSAETTDISGRGVGLDVVNAAVARLKGTLHIATEDGVGTTITLRLPVTLAINQSLLLESAGETFAVPLSSVDELVALSNEEVRHVSGRPVMMLRGRALPLLDLEERLDLAPAGTIDGGRYVIVISDGATQCGVIADRLIGREEIVVKSLGEHLKRVPYISGATILGDGRVILILDPARLLQDAAQAGAAIKSAAALAPALEAAAEPAARELSSPTSTNDSAHPSSAPKTETPRAPAPVRPSASPRDAAGRKRILVTDDSVSIRRFVGGLLEGAGYEVVLACDGVDALEKLDAERFDLVMTDLEMPRMHGYELLAEIKASIKHKALPVIILTSRMGEKHSRKGLELGASAYMVKPFEERELMANVERFIRQAAE